MARLRLGMSSYSYWHFTPDKVPMFHVLDEAARIGLDGIEILHQQLESEDNAYLQGLKRQALTLGLDLYALSIHQDFVDPDPAKRQEQIDHTIRCIEIAYAMGIPAIRLNSGRWGTIASFDDLMAARGVEPPLPGCVEDDAFAWVIESIERCLPAAEKRGVVLGLENHWGLTYTWQGVRRIVDAFDSPWLAVTMDTGNFLDDPYDSLVHLVRDAVLVHAKTYFGGGEWYTLDLDYVRIARLLQSVDYNGYVSIEFEGKEDAHTAVPKAVELLRAAWKQAEEGGVS